MNMEDAEHNEGGFETDEQDQVEKNLMIRKWLDNMPSSPSELTISDIEEPGLCFQSAAGTIGKSSYSLKTISEDTSIKDLLLSDLPLKYTCRPEPIMAPIERDALLTFADHKIPEINRQIASHPNYYPFSHVKGTAVWAKAASKSKRKAMSSWSILRFLAWIKTLSIFQWFLKKIGSRSSNHEDRQVKISTSSSISRDPESFDDDTVVFEPFLPPRTKRGQNVSGDTVFGGKNTQHEIHSAVNAISTKLSNFPVVRDVPLSEIEQMPNIGFSDGEVRIQPEISPLETPSVEEIQRLTTLLLEKKQTNKMKSIFGIRDFIRTDPHPSLIHIRRERTTTIARVYERILQIFRSRPRTPPLRRRRHRNRLNFMQPDVDQQNLNDVLSPQLQQVENQNHGRIQNIIGQIGGGLRGFMRLIGMRREERVFPENPPVPVPPLISVQDPQLSRGSRIHRYSRDQLRIILPSRGSIHRQNPLRRRILAEYPGIIELQDQSQENDGKIADTCSNSPKNPGIQENPQTLKE